MIGMATHSYVVWSTDERTDDLGRGVWYDDDVDEEYVGHYAYDDVYRTDVTT